MSVEPATKKVKLELTSCDEPLTQKDVIAFQKEALFRCIHQKLVSLNSLQTQYDLSKRQCVDVTRKLANLMALIVTLARFLEPICQVEDEKKICEEVAQGDETAIVELSDQFMKLLTKYSGNGGSHTNDEKLQGLAVLLQTLQKDKDELLHENNHLQEEVTRIKSYYEEVIHSYDREESQTVKRVFKKKEDTGDVSAKEEILPNGSCVRKEDSTPSNETSLVNGGNSSVGGSESGNEVERDLQIQDLKSHIDALQAAVQSLEQFKQQNQDEITTLRRQLQEQLSQAFGSTRDTRDSHWEKIQHLSRQNDELSQVNEDLLNKFQELSKGKEAYSNKLTQELHTVQETLKKHNSNLEKDLVRIRTTRDELLSKVAILEAETSKSTILQTLQSALDTLANQWSKLENRASSESSQIQDALLKELQDLEQAFKDLSSLTHKKYSEYINQESIISKLSVEKTKADQKYFAAMRSKDAILVENKNLSKSLTKSNDLISQFKDSDKLLQQKIINLTKQLQLSQSNEKRLIDSNKITTLKTMDLNSELSRLRKSLNSTKEENSKLTTRLTQLESKLQTVETELKSIRIKAHNYETKCEKLQSSLLANGGDNEPLVEELENFRTLVYCSLCSKNWKNMAIKSCGHVFCENCCKERLASRMRKCPTCNKAFSSNDLLLVHL